MTTKNAASFNSGGEGMARTTPFASLLLRLSLETFAPPKLAVQVAKARRYWQSQSNVPAYRYQAVSTVSSTLSRPVGREQALIPRVLVKVVEHDTAFSPRLHLTLVVRWQSAWLVLVEIKSCPSHPKRKFFLCSVLNTDFILWKQFEPRF